MGFKKFILLIVLLSCVSAFSQINQQEKFEIKGVVKNKAKDMPISGVQLSTSSGEYARTNAFGKYKIKVRIGDELLFESSEFETVQHRITNNEDVDVLVEDDALQSATRSTLANKNTLYKAYLDSAHQFKKKDLGKSIDYIRISLEQLNTRGDNKERAQSFSALGEIYEYHKQYDLAIDNYKESLQAEPAIATQILLGNAYILNKEYTNAEKTFQELVAAKKVGVYQKIQIYEGLGDAYKGLQDANKAVVNYKSGLQLAKQETVAPKITDLSTKLAEAYAADEMEEEAQVFFDSSLEAAAKEAPQKSLEVKERAADFYSQNNLYDKEIALRKKSLEQLDLLKASSKKKSETAEPAQLNSITSQGINYKIANTLIVQGKYEEAIPYLEKSIADAKTDDDLVVRKDATRKLSEVHEFKGEFTKALEVYRAYADVADTLYARKEQEIARAERLSKEIAAKQNRITGLEKDKELSDSKYNLAKTKEDLFTATTKKQQLLIYALIFGMLLFGLASFFFYRSNKQQKLANNLLALKSLRSQMNPHFIFNALNSVNNYISKNDERSANRFLSEFSTLMRAVLENSEEDFISLSKELELLALYVKLEHSRFPDKFSYTITTADTIDVDAFQIPPMLLQPYIENAIWHGLRYKEEKGFLNISLRQKDQETIEIIVEDNGIGRKKSAALKTQNQKKQRSQGMGNITKRVAILNDMYKDKVRVLVEDLYEDETGTKVILTLKKEV
ncbi:histidine kinase [Cellulophaga sp. F20128]|uniref:tetratricopeptide repeat-containing sensor histidine kinase n=1 Tax=Cellulophaga sp. F20128 TaxID=2926413 RepID=UPI001FF1684E|nr:histidine kinase [Cellulophaga sp. F20128]MCK0158845.1 histidine kinase [Cellulophaga sp. F20128]